MRVLVSGSDGYIGAVLAPRGGPDRTCAATGVDCGKPMADGRLVAIYAG